MTKKPATKSATSRRFGHPEEESLDTDDIILNLPAASGLSKPDVYSEAGNLYRHYCNSRTAVLTVTLPIVFGVDWILLQYIDTKNIILRELLLTVFGISMYIIACKANNYYARRIDIVRAKLHVMEISSDTRLLYANIEIVADNIRSKYGFLTEIFSHSKEFISLCVYFIGGIGIVLLVFILYLKWSDPIKRYIFPQTTSISLLTVSEGYSPALATISSVTFLE